MYIIRKETLETKTWSGGTTTELSISPQGSDYAERVFDFRVSSATVDLLESNFTPLPGVKRYLMILDGEMTIVHEGRGEKHLGTFEQDSFMGDYRTKSYSKAPVVDFNLMLQGARDGGLFYHPCEGMLSLQELTVSLDILENREFYCVAGPLEMIIGNHSIRLFKGDYLKLQQMEMLKAIEVSGKGSLVEIKVWSV